MSDIKENSTSENTSIVVKVEENQWEGCFISEHSSDDEISSIDTEVRGVSKYWTTNKCIELIRLFRSKTLLWSTADPNYYKMYMKRRAWKDIAKAFNQPTLACRNKMNILQSSFRREKARIMKSKGQYKPCWYGFREMCFLLNKNTKERAFKENVDKPFKKHTQQLMEESDVMEHDNVLNEESDALIIDHDYVIPDTENVTNQTNDESKDKVEVINTDFLNFTNSTSEININQITHVDNPETVSFLNFIGNKMKKYDEQTKLEAQQAICEVMFKLDRKFYMEKQDLSV